MTREEAIELLEDVIGFIEDNHGRDYDTAFRMAIEALSADITETEECRKCQETTERVLNNQGERIKELEESAETVQGWIPLSYDDYGLGTDFPHERDGEWVIVTDGKNISVERIKKDAYDHFFPNGRWFELEDVIAWMPLPNTAFRMAIGALTHDSDLISRQWLLDLYGDYIGDNGDPKYHVPLEVVRQNIIDAPSAEAVEVVQCKECEIKAYAEKLVDAFIEDGEELAESAEAVHIHNDGTLEVKVPNAQKVGRVLVMDTDSHIGGGLFYPDEAVQGWIPVSERLPSDGRRCLVFYDGPIIGSYIDIMRYGEPLMPNVDVSGKHFYKSDSEWGDIIYDEIAAWMPLPMPYREDDDEII